MSRPVIGITTYAETARWGVWNCPAVLVPADYVRQVSGAGGVPVLLPPDATADWLNPGYNAEEVVAAALTEMEYRSV